MRKHKKFLAAFLSMLLSLSLILSAGFTGVFAASGTTYSMADLLNSDQVKLIGRTANIGGKLLADWVGSGFEMNVNVTSAGTFDVAVEKTNTNEYYVDIVIDGTDVTRTPLTNSGTVSAPITAGNHTVRVIRDSQNNNATVSGSTVTLKRMMFTSVTFAGTVITKPADKDLFIEFVGDSLCCGDGAVGEFQAGVKWTEPRDDSVLGSFAYNAAQNLNADYSLVARGGIGLTGSDAQQIADTITIDDVYDYATYDGFTLNEQKYDFSSARKPDMVVIEIGANDGQKAAILPTWKEKAYNFINQIRTDWNDPELPIVWITTGNNYEHNLYMRSLAETDKNLFPWRYYQGGSGSAALATQEAGHPSKTQQIEWGKQLAQFISNEVLTANTPAPVLEEPAPKANTVTVWVDGAAPSEANHYQYIKEAEAALATKVKTLSGGNDKIAAIMYVSNKNGAVRSAADSATASNLFGNATTVKDKDGKIITIQMIGVDDAGTGNATDVYVSNHTASWRAATNSYRFKNVCISGTGVTNGAFTQIYLAGYETIFDENTSLYQSTATKAHSTFGLSTLYGGHASNSTATKAGVNTNVIINSDNFKANYVYPGGINRYSAGYNSTTTTFDLNTGSATTIKFTMYKGTVVTLATGNPSMVGGKNCSAILTVNGGTVTNLYNGLYSSSTSKPSLLEQSFNSEVIINGGTVTNYLGAFGNGMTLNGTYTTTINGGTITGDFFGVGNSTDGTTVNKVVNNINGGILNGANFYGVGENATVTTLENNMTAGKINCVNAYFGGGKSANATTVTNNIIGGEVISSAVTNGDGIHLGASTGSNITTLTNNVSGGRLTNIVTTSTANSQTYFGSGNSVTIGTHKNNISGGAFVTHFADGIKAAGTCGIYLGSYNNSNTKTFVNNVTGGLFDLNQVNKGSYIFGAQGLNNAFESVTNTVGIAGTDIGPVFAGALNVNLSGGWGKIGAGVKSNSTLPTSTDVCTDTVIISNTVNYMETNSAVSAGTSGCTPASNWYSFVNGSVETVINGGLYKNTVYLGGAKIFGHVKSIINGGVFKDVYGYGCATMHSEVYDGTELIINGFNSYANLADKSYDIYAGSNTATVVTPKTVGRDAISLTINGGTFPTRCGIYGGSNTGTINGNISTAVNGGSFVSLYCGSKNATINGNINNIVSGGEFTGNFFGGNANGSVNGHITNTISTSGKMAGTYAGSEDGTVTDGVETHITKYRTVTADRGFYGGNRNGTISLKADSEYDKAILVDVNSAKHSDKYNTGDVSIDGSIFATGYAGNVNGDIYVKLSGGNNCATGNTARHLVTGNQTIAGVINGNITVDIERGGYYGSAVYYGHRTAPSTPTTAQVNGDITINLKGGHIGTINNPNAALTFNGKAVFNLDLTDTSSIINNVVGGDNAKYTVNVKGGKGALTTTANTRLYADTVTADAQNPIKLSQYSAVANGTVLAKLPGDAKDFVTVEKQTASLTNECIATYNGETTNVISLNNIETGYAAQFELDEAIKEEILFPADGNIKTIINAAGRANYSYTFMGETVEGYFTKSTPVKTIGGNDYYSVTFPVPTGKFDEVVTITCDGMATKSITATKILETGEEQYEEVPEISKLFTSIIDYGKEVSALFYNGEAPQVDYSGTDELKEKYKTEFQFEDRTLVRGTSLLLQDKVNVQLYLETNDITAIDGVFLNGEMLSSGDYTISEVTEPSITELGIMYVISVPIVANKMAKEFNISISCDGVITDNYTSSLGFYCATYMEADNPLLKKFENLSRALLRYIEQVSICYPEE